MAIVSLTLSKRAQNDYPGAVCRDVRFRGPGINAILLSELLNFNGTDLRLPVIILK